MKEKFDIGGMTCSACAAHVSKAVCKLNVTSVNVNLLTNSMEVEYDKESLSSKEIIDAVEKAGYSAKIHDDFVGKQTRKVNSSRIKLILSVILLVILMYFSMHEMLHLPYPEVLHNYLYGLIGVLIQLVLCIVIMILNAHYFINGFKKLIKLSPNMDTLVALGSFVSFVYALINTILMIGCVVNKDSEGAMSYSMNLYYESAAMILTLVSVGKFLEGLSKKQTTKALESLINMVPKTVLKKNGDEFEEVLKENIAIGDIILLKPYSNVAIDGFIIDGASHFDESSLTGESVLISKKEGDEITSGSINQEGTITYKASKTSASSTISEIIKMVEEASSSKMPLARIADKIALYFVPIVISISLITFLIWIISSKDIELSLGMAISVLVISCPCALGLATPLCIMVSTGLAYKNNILLKEASSLEHLSGINTIILDKTGTITNGQLKVVDYISFNEDSKNKLYSLEKNTNHPLSVALTSYLKTLNVEECNFDTIETVPGYGIKGSINNEEYYVGSLDYYKLINNKSNDTVEKLISEGKTIVVLFTKNEILSIISLIDTIKSDAKKAISLFKSHGIKIVMATGDNEVSANSIASEVGIDIVEAKCLPQYKSQLVDKYKENNKKVLMIGDGINDAIALTKADVSMAFTSKNDIATNSADIVLLKPNLMDAYNAYILSKKTVNNIKMNLFWAFFYNIVMIPIACGILYPSLGIRLTPMIGAACMSLSSICVCLNALRLKLFKWKEEEKLMQEFYVRDMMCPRCVAHVKEALSVEGVKSVDVNLENKKVTVESNLSLETLMDYVKKAGYQPTKD